MDRRRALYAMGLGSMAFAAGCCRFQASTRSKIVDEQKAGLSRILAPSSVVRSPAEPSFVMDVHAHFFNASDVPVRGFIEGPMAHSAGALGPLLLALAPYAERLARRAPDAATEYAALIKQASVPSTKEAAKQLRDAAVANDIETSEYVYEILRGTAFEAEYNRLGPGAGAGESARYKRASAFGRDSVRAAMHRDLAPAQTLVERKQVGVADRDGILAFIGFMLSARSRNLLAYQEAYTTSPDAFGVDCVFGALVDLERWLCGEVRSSQDDQIKLHTLLSELSSGYMRPIVAFNPWIDGDLRAALDRVSHAIVDRGFVGIKIYPPMGFRPYGNVDVKDGRPNRRPNASELNTVLAALWELAEKLDVPVMGHTNDSMGATDIDEQSGGPEGWRALLNESGQGAPRIHLAHFGGDDDSNEWSEEFGRIMEMTRGTNVFGDIAYWDGLASCDATTFCAARERLKGLLERHPVVKDRLMYGSDWMMISRQRAWPAYPHQIAEVTAPLIDHEKLFGGNAKQCFSRALGRE